MSINEELLAFANGRAPWQRDCLRRICTQSDLTQTDIQEVLANLKATEGLADAGAIQDLDASHLAARPTTPHVPTILNSISNVKNTNRLASNQVLPFAERGITLIYGYNGSGKTGYGRILKQVCRTRHEKQEPILGDAYATGKCSPASAKVDYKFDGKPKTLNWIDGSNIPSELRSISVFDATTAPLYADKQNRIEFLPMGLDVLPKLGNVCELLTEEIKSQIRAIDQKIAVPLPKVETGGYLQFLERLSSNATESQLPTEEEIRALFTWTSDNEAELNANQGEMRKYSEPAAQSGHLARLIGVLYGFKPRIESAFTALSHQRIAEAQQRVADARNTREAANIAATGRFTNDPLGEAPRTAAWRKLYESAEAFSAEVYPDDEFPSTVRDRVCLLCQQPISEVARERFRQFKEFVQGETQKNASRAEKELAAFTREVSDIAIPDATGIDLLFQELTDSKPSYVDLRDAIKQQCVALATLKLNLSRCLNGEAEFATMPTIDPAVLGGIDADISSLTVEKQSFDEQTKDTATLSNLRSQLAELIDRKNCASNLAIFLSRRSDICTREAWKRCREQCETAPISRKNSDLRDKYLTKAFTQAVVSEIKYLGLDYLPIKVEGKTERTVGYIGVALSKSGREATSRILSEGEFRGLALACFFAEIDSIAGHDGIIVDDPVSSLDHLHVEQIARRLVYEAKKRPQVIVFTHDLTFYYDLWVAAAEAGVPVHRNWIYKDGTNGFGHVNSDDGPWQVKKTDERIKILRTMIAAFPDQASTPPDDWQQKTEGFYSKLREAWERLVEECLLNKVVGRFQPQVATQSLKGVSVTDEDYRKIFFAMKRASEFSGHDRPAGRSPVTRTKDEMNNDVVEIWNYEKELRRRNREIEDVRKLLENPPLARISQPLANSGISLSSSDHT